MVVEMAQGVQHQFASAEQTVGGPSIGSLAAIAHRVDSPQLRDTPRNTRVRIMWIHIRFVVLIASSDCACISLLLEVSPYILNGLLQCLGTFFT